MGKGTVMTLPAGLGSFWSNYRKWTSRALYAVEQLDFAYRTVEVIDPNHPEGRRTLKVRFLRDEDLRDLLRNKSSENVVEGVWRVTIVRDEGEFVQRPGTLLRFKTPTGRAGYTLQTKQQTLSVIRIPRIFRAPKNVFM